MTARKVDYAWILSFLPAELPALFAVDPFRNGAHGLDEVEPSVAFVAPSWIRCCPGFDGGSGSMNIKLMLVRT